MKTSYQDSQSLTYQTKKFSAFLTTDKGIYKPEDKVKFSIFCIDSETLPYNPKGGSVVIYDSADFKVKTFTNISFVRGKFKESLTLTEKAVKGEWKIIFKAEGEVTF